MVPAPSATLARVSIVSGCMSERGLCSFKFEVDAGDYIGASVLVSGGNGACWLVVKMAVCWSRKQAFRCW